METNYIHCGDNVEFMKSLPDESVDLTVTSPPYDDLRAYNGYIFDFESVAKELYRITKDGGVVVWVVGDKTKNGSESGTSFRQALYFKEIGFRLHDTMIYEKSNPMPNAAKRYLQSFEYMFVFSKGAPQTFNPIMLPCKYAGCGTSPRQWTENGELKGNGRRVISETKKASNIFTYTVGNVGNGNVLHPAVFPESLAEDQIKSWSNPGDVVFDPFMGSGTTAKMALLNDRNYIGCEISEEYVLIAKQRLEEAI